MKKVIDFRFLFTPYATTYWNMKSGIKRKYIYIFGFKIIDIVV